MTKDDLEFKAREWLEKNTPLRWTTEGTRSPDEAGLSLEELNRRPQMWAERLAAFAAQVVQEERKRIEAKLFHIYRHNNDPRHAYPDPCLVCEILDEVQALGEELSYIK